MQECIICGKEGNIEEMVSTVKDRPFVSKDYIPPPPRAFAHVKCWERVLQLRTQEQQSVEEIQADTIKHPSSEEEQTCGNCRFWRERAADIVGECRRYAPKVFSRISPNFNSHFYCLEIATAVPETKKDFWCGEWKEKEYKE
jgi:hypothetical protein